MVVQISFLKCDMLSQIQDRYSKVLLSLLMTSSFRVSKLYSLSSRFTEQKARLCCVGGGGWVFFFSIFCRKHTGNHHRPLTATSRVLLSGRVEEVHHTVMQSVSVQHE